MEALGLGPESKYRRLYFSGKEAGVGGQMSYIAVTDFLVYPAVLNHWMRYYIRRSVDLGLPPPHHHSYFRLSTPS